MDRLPPTPLTNDPLSEYLLPWSRVNKLHLLLALPPFTSLSAEQVIPHASPLLPATRFRKSEKSTFQAAYYPRQALNAARHVCMICVLDGEADIRIGVTERMALASPLIGRDAGGYTLRLTARTLLVVPPGVPYSDGSRGHWERPNPEDARSCLLWMLFLPQGVHMHICRTEGKTHSGGASQIICDTGYSRLLDALLGELNNSEPCQTEVTQHLVTALLLRLNYVRNPDRKKLLLDSLSSNAPMPFSLPSHTVSDKVVERACSYIQQNINAPLSVDRIAAGTHISPTHLNRLFRAELQSSVMAYVERMRVEASQNLLAGTDLSIRAVSQQVGYSHPNYFSQVFRRLTGKTPSHFRRHTAKEPDNTRL